MRISCSPRMLLGSSTACSHRYRSSSRAFAISRALATTGARASRPVMALAFAMRLRLYFLRDTRLDLFFQPVSIQAHQEAFQLALFLLAKALQAVEQPLRAGSRISARMLQARLQVLQHDIGITRSSQGIGGFRNAAVHAPEGFRPAAGLKSIERSAQAARRDTHPMHRFNIFMFEHFIWKLQKFLQALAQHTPPGLLERLYLSLYPIWTNERGAGSHKSGQ